MAAALSRYTQLRVVRDPEHVWLVDDSPLQAEVCRRVLATSYRMSVFTDPVVALEALAAGPPPDLLVLDWRMPELSGLEVCKAVRERFDAAHLPILILTVSGMDALPEALAAGANDFVVKPFSPTELRARSAALLRGRALHTELREADLRLRGEAEFRERFVDMLAHDLRQPLNTFMMTTELMRRTSGPPSPDHLDRQARATKRMSRMISDLLDFARSRAEGGMPIDRQPTDLVPLATAIIEDMRAAHPARRIELSVVGPTSGAWDKDRVTQIFTNLLGNALEHGEVEEPIEVGLDASGEAVRLTVANRGKPIEPALLPGIFAPYRRGKPGSPSGGLGLGLHIVSEIARAHGGAATVESDASRTVFAVTLPR